MFLNKKTQLIDIISPGFPNPGNTSQRIQFTDQPYLRGMLIKGIEIFSSADLSISPSGNILPTIAQLKGAYLTLYMDDPDNNSAQGEYMQNLPMLKMRNLNDNTAGNPFSIFAFNLAGQTIYWEKSYITLPAAGGLGNTVNVSFLFNVSFEDKK